ncbi:hypothetical protein RK21_04154 [Pseudomonas plecoglossicida]|nr:hypothetical protein RK21_04154 [Pseudomonas plecoglossicida]
MAGDSHLYGSSVRAKRGLSTNSLTINKIETQGLSLITAFCMIAAWAFVQIAVWSALFNSQVRR